jgi:hypothetical protein
MFFHHHPTSIIIKGYCSPSSPLISAQNQNINQHPKSEHKSAQKSAQNHNTKICTKSQQKKHTKDQLRQKILNLKIQHRLKEYCMCR